MSIGNLTPGQPYESFYNQTPITKNNIDELAPGAFQPKPKGFNIGWYDEPIETLVQGIYEKNVFGKPYDEKFRNAGEIADGIPAAVANYNHYSGHVSHYKDRPTAAEIQQDPHKSPTPYASPFVQIFDVQGSAANRFGTAMDPLTYQLIHAIGNVKRYDEMVDVMVAQELRRRLNESRGPVPQHWELRPDNYYMPQPKPSKNGEVEVGGMGDMVFKLFNMVITDANPPQFTNWSAYDEALATVNRALVTAENPDRPSRFKKAASAMFNLKGVKFGQPDD